MRTADQGTKRPGVVTLLVAGIASAATYGCAATDDYEPVGLQARGDASRGDGPRGDGSRGESPRDAEPETCTLRRSSVLNVAPAAEGQAFRRCGTLGGERAFDDVALSSDHARLAARTDTGTVRLIATDGVAEIAELAAPLGKIDAMAFSPDGTLLATAATEMGQVALWRASDGSLVRAYAGPALGTIDNRKQVIAFDREGRRIATPLGTVIDVASGAVTGWDGTPVDVALTPNPRQGGGGSLLALDFVDDGNKLFVHREYGIGNSPTTASLALVQLDTGAEHMLYHQYASYFDGAIVSANRRRYAIAGHPGASIPGLAPSRGGLGIYDVGYAQLLVSNPNFAGVLLGASPDLKRLYVHLRDGEAVLDEQLVVFDGALQGPIARFAWPAGGNFPGVAPDGTLVVAEAEVTTFRDPDTGAVRRTVDDVLTRITWSADRKLAAALGTSTMLHLVRARGNGGCRLPFPEPDAPGLAALGSSQTADGTLMIAVEQDIHTRATNWHRNAVRRTDTGELVRIFGAHPSHARPGPEIAIAPAGDKVYTRDADADTPIAVWCE
ncbi:MAG: WD40 repeat domain-containing protein [Polyangiales bacterium]